MPLYPTKNEETLPQDLKVQNAGVRLRAGKHWNVSLQDRRWKNQVELLNLMLGGDWPPACF